MKEYKEYIALWKWYLFVDQSYVVKSKLNIKGTSLNTWALLSYLNEYYLNDEVDYNSHYLINKRRIIKDMAICRFNPKSLTKHLNLLKDLGLIDILVERKRMYFKVTLKAHEYLI